MNAPRARGSGVRAFAGLSGGVSEMSEAETRRALVEVCRRMWVRGYISGGEGNVSARLGPRRLLVTPSGVNKGFLDEQDLVTVDPTGRKIAGKRSPTSEVCVHVACYEERPDIGAVVHAHPSTAVALSLAGVPLTDPVLPEAAALGPVPEVPYATPGTPDAGNAVRDAVRDHDAFMMQRHGPVCVGRDAFAAFDRMEAVESVARVLFMARLMGPFKPLPDDEVARIKKAAAAMRGLACWSCTE